MVAPVDKLPGPEDDLVRGARPDERSLRQVEDVETTRKPGDDGGGAERADLQRLQADDALKALVPAGGADVVRFDGDGRDERVRRVARRLGGAPDVAGAQRIGRAVASGDAAADGVVGVAEHFGFNVGSVGRGGEG